MISCHRENTVSPDPAGRHVTGNLATKRDINICRGKIKICGTNCSPDRTKRCEIGRWRIQNGKIEIRREQVYGTRGVGNPSEAAAAAEAYEKYEDYREQRSGVTELAYRDEINDDRSGTWKIEKYTGSCD